MNANQVVDLARDSIFLAVALSAPVMIAGLIVGVVIGLLQALTQIQEATLIYAPKILVVFITLLFFLPLMGRMMGDFMQKIAALIVGT